MQTAYHSQPIKKTKTHVFQMKPLANQMDQLYGDSAVKRPIQTEDDPSTIEKTVKRFQNSNYSNGLSTDRQSIEFRDPKTKQVFLRASILETEQNLKRLSLIISESEETTHLRNPAELPPSCNRASSSAKSYAESDARSKKTIAGQNI